jgi:hypothetical protein
VIIYEYLGVLALNPETSTRQADTFDCAGGESDFPAFSKGIERELY